MKKLIVLVMSVGPHSKNGTCKYLESIGGKDNMVVVLPKQFESNKDSYLEKGIKVYVYDEKKYINDDFEFFGFKPRNCGGIGRSGIAEATDALSDDNTLLLQLDDDTATIAVRKHDSSRKCGWRAVRIRHFSALEEIYNALDEFYRTTGIKVQLKQDGAITSNGDIFWAARKIFNNFLMYPDDKYKYKGFAELCSDDVIYNYYKNLLDCTPCLSIHKFSIGFTQSQGNRNDGNAPLYNKDCSWKKSFALRMVTPAFSTQRVANETMRILFRETLLYSKIYPPIMLTDKDGKITFELKII